MTNSYFNYTDPVQPGDRIESFKYNNDFGAIAKAFDSLPSPEQLATNNSNYAVSTGTATAYQVSLPFFEGDFGYIEGMQVVMKAHVTNTGPATVSVNGAAPVPLRNFHTGTGPTYALVAGDIAIGAIYSLRYDGTYFQVVNTVATALVSSQVAASTASTAATNATNAANSAVASRNTASDAANTATAAQGSASASAATATSAASSAASSASSAASSASSASADAVTAVNASNSASASATAANNSALAAGSSSSAANTFANNAASSATAASNSAAAAANSAAAAQAVLTDPAFKNAVLNYLYTTSLRLDTVKYYASNVDPNTLFPGTSWTRLPADFTIRTAAANGSNVMTTAGSDTASLSTPNLPPHSHNATITINNYTFAALNTSTFTPPAQLTSDTDLGSVVTDSYNFGTVSTSSNTASTVTSTSSGTHTHNITVRQNGNLGVGAAGEPAGVPPSQPALGAAQSQAAGAHTHNITFPAHSHSLTLGAHNHTISFGSHNHSVTPSPHNHTVTVPAHNHTATTTVLNTGQGAQFIVRNKVLYLVGWRRTA